MHGPVVGCSGAVPRVLMGGTEAGRGAYRNFVDGGERLNDTGADVLKRCFPGAPMDRSRPTGVVGQRAYGVAAKGPVDPGVNCVEPNRGAAGVDGLARMNSVRGVFSIRCRSKKRGIRLLMLHSRCVR